MWDKEDSRNYTEKTQEKVTGTKIKKTLTLSGQMHKNINEARAPLAMLQKSPWFFQECLGCRRCYRMGDYKMAYSQALDVAWKRADEANSSLPLLPCGGLAQ